MKGEGREFVLAELPGLQRDMLNAARAWVRPGEDAQDLVQEASLKVLLAAEQFRKMPGKTLKGWVMTIMLNLLRTQRRRSWRQINNLETETFDWLIGSGAEGEQESRQTLAETLSKLSTLNPDSAESVMLIASGFSYDEVAERQGVLVGTVKSRVCRAREALKEQED